MRRLVQQRCPDPTWQRVRHKGLAKQLPNKCTEKQQAGKKHHDACNWNTEPAAACIRLKNDQSIITDLCNIPTRHRCVFALDII
jgi:hypothetical protein